MELTLREFENLNLYSNKNMEKVIKKLVNESSNAALTSMFDDSLILLDHMDGKFYAADYSFDEKNLTLSIDNFEEVSLVKEEEDFKESVENFFEDENASAKDLAKAYKEKIVEQEKYIDELISEVVSAKDFSDMIDYKAIAEVKKELTLESVNEKFFSIYENRINEMPMTSIKYFDWNTPIKVSLIEGENHKTINTSLVEKAKSNWKNVEFKTLFLEAAEDILEGNDEKMLEVFEKTPALFYMGEDDKITLFGKSLLGSDLFENRKEIVAAIKSSLSESNFVELKEQYISEEEEEGIEEPEEASASNAKLELSDADVKKLISDLNAIKEKLEDETAKNKIDSVIEKLSSTESEGTNPATVKEAVSILNL